MVTNWGVFLGNYVSKMRRLENESNSDISACKITEQTFWWWMKGRNLVEGVKNETISHSGCNGNFKINDETNIIRLRSYTPVKQRNWLILVWFVFSVRFSMLFYSSYHSFIAKGVENSPLEHHTEHPKNESSFRNGQVVMFQSLQPCKIFNCRRGVFYSRKTQLKRFRSISFCFLFLWWFSDVSWGLFFFIFTSKEARR